MCLLPLKIPFLYQAAYEKLTNDNLQTKCQDVFSGLEMTEEEEAYPADTTKLQSKSLTWFEHRRVQITALKFHTICHTIITSPSQSLVKQILAVGGNVSSAAIVWGIKSEKVAVLEFQPKGISKPHLI